MPAGRVSRALELIEDGDELRASGINLESQWAEPWKGSTRKRLTQGTDYDLVVLGISIAALGSICRQLVEHLPQWRDMIERSGYRRDAGDAALAVAEPRRAGVAVALDAGRELREPGANWLHASQVIPFERLPSQIGSVAYFCSVLQDLADDPGSRSQHLSPTDQRRGVQQAHQRWIEQHAAHLWPALTGSAGGPAPINWELLHDPDNRNGAARLDWHYFRANVEPSDRFVLSSVDATRFRLRPDQSGAGNLILPATGRTTSSTAAVSRER